MKIKINNRENIYLNYNNYKVGQKVMILGDFGSLHGLKIGTIATISTIDNESNFNDNDNRTPIAVSIPSEEGVWWVNIGRPNNYRREIEFI